MFFNAAISTLALLASPAFATLYTTNPVASSALVAGESVEVTWMDDGAAPQLETIGVCSVDLCIGSWTKQECIQNLAESVDVSKATSLSATIDPTVGENGLYYFIRFQSADYTANGVPYQQFSARFRIDAMTGNFTEAEMALATAPTEAPTKSGSAAASGASGAATASVTAPISGSAAAGASTTSAAPSSASSKAAASSSAAPSASASTSGARALAAPAGLVLAGVAAFLAL